MRRTGATHGIDGDAAAGADGEVGHLRQADVGADADRADDEAGGDRGSVGQDHCGLGELHHGSTGVDGDAVGDELGLDEDGHLGVEWREQLVRGLHDRGGDAGTREVLGRLDPDESSSDHDGRGRCGSHIAEETLGIFDGPKHPHPIETLDGGPHREGTGAQDELVVRQERLVAATRRPDRHRLGHGIDPDDLSADADIEPEAVEEPLRGLEQEVRLVLDHPTDEVRQPTVGVGDVT